MTISRCICPAADMTISCCIASRAAADMTISICCISRCCRHDNIYTYASHLVLCRHDNIYMLHLSLLPTRQCLFVASCALPTRQCLHLRMRCSTTTVVVQSKYREGCYSDPHTALTTPSPAYATHHRTSLPCCRRNCLLLLLWVESMKG